MNGTGVLARARARVDGKARRQSLRTPLTGRTPFVRAAPAGKIRLMHPTGLIRIAALLVALALTDCAQNPVTGNPNLVLMTESQEIAIGRREDANVRRQYDVYDDPALQQYVNEIGQGLAQAR